MAKWLEHLCTVNHHRFLVMGYCFRVGLYQQGLTHDLSKYSPSEFLSGVKYFQGTRSPNEAERVAKGYSAAWLHHKGRNKHHLEYWLDYSPRLDFKLTGMPMPRRYVVEMFCDRMAASKTYRRGAYRDQDPLDYYKKSADYVLLNQESRVLLEQMLHSLAEKGEAETFAMIRREILPPPQNSLR